eukprot:13821347-Alexandrium_andersonii.AAC.1
MGNRALWTALPRQRRRTCGLSLASELLRQTSRTRYLAWQKAVARARGGFAVMAVLQRAGLGQLSGPLGDSGADGRWPTV